MIDLSFYKNKKVLITGHTGFKGSWLCKILLMAGANVTGYSLEPPTNPSLFKIANLDKQMNSIIGDIRDLEKLQKVFEETKPEIVFHLAAQPIVRTSYENPVYTYETNNDVTWLNFKQAIITLLDQMVSSGVLQTYKVNRKPSSDTERNKMIAIIKIYPVLPVENFDVYINLENAELTTTADDIQA